MRPQGTAIGPHKLLLILLYGQHIWIERDTSSLDGLMRFPVSKIAKHMKCRPNRIQQYLYQLENMNVIEALRWNPYWITLRVRAPEGMVRKVGPVWDIPDVPTQDELNNKVGPGDSNENY